MVCSTMVVNLCIIIYPSRKLFIVYTLFVRYDLYVHHISLFKVAYLLKKAKLVDKEMNF